MQRVLAAKEERAVYQKEKIHQYELPLISLTLNLPGGYFQYANWDNVMKKAVEEIDRVFGKNTKATDQKLGKWGPEGYWTVALPIEEVKKKAIQIEEQHSLGRLFDIDVINLEGSALSRRDFNLPPRKCIACNNPAVECYVSKRHTGEELKIKVDEMIDKGLNTVC